MRHILFMFYIGAVILVISGCKNPTELDGDPPIVIKDPLPPVTLTPFDVKGEGDYEGFTDDVRWQAREFRRVSATLDTSDEKRALLTLRGAIAASSSNFSLQKLQPGRLFHEIKEIVFKCDSLPIGQPFLRDDLIDNKVEILFLVKTHDRKTNGVIDTNTRYIPLSVLDPFSTFSMRVQHRVLLPNIPDRKVVVLKCDFGILFPPGIQGGRKIKLSGRSELFLKMP